MNIGQQSKNEILDDYSNYVNPGRVSVFRRMGLEFVPGKREGVWLWDVDGKTRVLNCRCSGGVFNLGHRPAEHHPGADAGAGRDRCRRPHAAQRGASQAGQAPGRDTPGDIQYSTFSPAASRPSRSGIKLARAYTGRPGIISVHKGYHGHTGLALATRR